MNPNLKIAVLNYSGNVGKSTLARHLLAPRMQGCSVTFIESINEGGDASQIKGKDFLRAMVDVRMADQAIVDIGSSNIEQVLARTAGMDEILEMFDYFLVPTVPKHKQQTDTVNMIEALMTRGVQPGKIKVVFNHAERDDDAEKAFGSVKAVTTPLEIRTAVVHENEGFAWLGARKISTAAARNRDFKKELLAESDPSRKREIAEDEMAALLARSIERELDRVFAELFEAA